MLDIGQEPPTDTLGARIKAVRIANKLRLGATANKIGVSRTTLGQWEADAVKNPDIEKLTAFVRLTDVSLDWLVEGKGDDPAFLAVRRTPKPALVAASNNNDGAAPRRDKDEMVPEIAGPLTAHASGLDLTPKAFWVMPQQVLELSFNCEPGRAVMKRVVTRDGGEFGLLRGDYVLIDASRTRIDEPGIYLVADPAGQSARRAKVEFDGDQLVVTVLGDDLQRSGPQPVGDNLTVLGRVMGIFKPV